MKYIFGFYVILFLSFVLYLTSVMPKSSYFVLDYRPFYIAGKMIQTKTASKLYSLPHQLAWQKKLFETDKKEFLLGYFNPPFVSLLFFPFSFFSFRDSYILFNLLSGVIFLSTIWFLFRLDRAPPGRWKLVFLFALSLLFEPVLFALSQGQVSFYLLLGVVGSWYSLKANHPRRAGMWLGILCIKPQLLILPLLLLIVKRQWQVILGFLSVLGVFFCISFLLVGVEGMKQYGALLTSLAGMPSVYGLALSVQPTLLGVVFALFPHLGGLAFWAYYLCVIVLGSSALLWVWRGKWDPQAKSFDFRWGILIVLMILVSMHTHEFDLVLLFAPIVILLRDIKKDILFYLSSFIIVVVSYIPWERMFVLPLFMLVLCFLLYRKKEKHKKLVSC